MEQRRRTEVEAIRLIADLLDGKEWSADTLEIVAQYVRDTGRDVRDFTPGDEEQES